jgi:hypothetical protein
MSDNLQRAIAAIRSGDKAAGKRLLAQILQAEPGNQTAWLWMSAVVDTDEERAHCLERVLEINPHNETAQRGLEALRQKQTTPPQAHVQPETSSDTGVSQTIWRLDQSATRKCPYCAETIKAEAKVCRFCGRDLKTGQPSEYPTKAVIEQVPHKKRRSFFTIFLAVIGLITIVCCGLYFLGEMLLSSPGTSGSPKEGSVRAEDLVIITKGEWRCYHDSIGNAILEGKVWNSSNIHSLRFVELRATILSSGGSVINTSTGYIDSDILAPNSTSTFRIYVDDPNNEGDDCRIRVESARFAN